MNTIPRAKEKGASSLEHQLAHRRQGSDPLLQTARGKLQSQRSRLNDQINRELRLRAGAENLFKATTNKKLRETVGLELSYVNSNLQLLKEELADLNSSVHVYQNENATQCVPMLPLGLKETKEVDFKTTFKEYIIDHYYEDPVLYERELQELSDIRQACRTPTRNEAGVNLLFEYYNQLYFIEKRFFPPTHSLGIYFEWYDSLTGVPSAQRTVGFEKGSVLFNVGALYTQIGARQDRTQYDGVSAAIENFQRAAGTFHYLHSNFSHAPSMDMQPMTLSMLTALMLAQSQECVYERIVLVGVSTGLQAQLVLAKEAAKVSELYRQAYCLMLADGVKDYIPPSWVSMVATKTQYFSAVAHFITAGALLEQCDSNNVDVLATCFEGLHISTATVTAMKSPTNYEERKNLAKSHLRESTLQFEEALRLHNQSKQLRRIDTFQDILRTSHDRSLQKFSELEEEDDFSELQDVPRIQGKTSLQVDCLSPDFLSHKVDDLFLRLGPLAIFSARHQWSPPHTAELIKKEGQDFGFSVRGDSPVIIAMVEERSLAQKSGMKVGDFIVGVGGRDLKWNRHEEVVTLIRQAGSRLEVTLITPMDRNYLSPSSSVSSDGSLESPGVTSMQSTRGRKSNKLDKSDRERRSMSGPSWTLRKRNKSKDKKTGLLINGHDTSMTGR